MASEDSLQRIAKTYADSEMESLLPSRASAFLDSLRNPDDLYTEGALSDYNDIVLAADSYMDKMGDSTIQREPGQYLGTILSQMGDGYIYHLAEEIMSEYADDIAKLLDDIDHDTDDIRVSVSNPYGHMVHIKEEDLDIGTQMIYKFEGATHYVIRLLDHDIYLSYSEENDA